MSAFGAGTCTFDSSGNISSSSDERLKTEIGIPERLRNLGVTEDQLPVFAEKSFAVKRILRVNPRAVTAADLESILRAAW